MNDDQQAPSVQDQLRHQGVILENVQDQLTRFAEAMADVPAKLDSVDKHLSVVKEDMKIVKAAVTDQSQQLGDHEERITHLEQAA